MKGNNFFKITKWLMILAGTWEQELVGASKVGQKIYRIYSIMLTIMYHTCPFSYVMKFWDVWGSDTKTVVEYLSISLIVCLLPIKMALCRRKRMTTVLQEAMENINNTLVHEDEDEHVKNLLSADSRYANILGVLLTIWSFSVGVVLTIGSLFEILEFQRTHNMTDTTVEMPLAMECWYPFDVRTHYILVIEYQFFNILFSDLYNAALQSLTNTLMIQISTHIKVLQHQFRNFTKDKKTGQKVTEQQAYINLRELIRNHQKLITHTKKLDEALKSTLLIEYGLSSFMLATIIIQIISGNKPFFNSIYVGIIAFDFFMLSWNANEILLQSAELSAAVYESNWFEYGKSVNQLMFIVMMRTKDPLFLRIGPFGAMTIDAAISRTKLAYSYVSVISTSN